MKTSKGIKTSVINLRYTAKVLIVLSLFLLCIFPLNTANAAKKSKPDNNSEYFKNEDDLWQLNTNLYRIKYNNLEFKINRDFFSLKWLNRIFNNQVIINQQKESLFNSKVTTNAILMFTGDLMCLRGQQYSAETKTGYDFKPCFELVKPLFKSADFVCGNLETLISESNPTTKVQNTINGTPQCNGPEVYLKALKDAGYDALVTANNHCCDWGPVGITETKEKLDKYNFANVGTNYSENYVPYILFDVNNIKVAVLSYTHLVNQRGKMSAYELSTMVNCFDIVKVREDIALAKEAGAEFVVVYCHWGTENTTELNWFQTNDSQEVANAGADLIIGSHPHCLQRCEYLTTDDGREVLCMYSMGNFVSSMARETNNDTIILRVELSKKGNSDKVNMNSATYIPCFVTSYNGKNNVIVPIDNKLNGNLNWNSLKNSYGRITKILKKIDVYEVQA